MNNNKIGAFTKMCCTIGNLPSSYMMSMSYEEQLLWLCNYLEKTIIPAVNENGEAVDELQAQFNLLKNYVDNYFDNLDIQTEIDNKLDEMAESGQLTDIIAQYLELAGILAYNTLSDLENADNIVDGSFTKTYGKLTYNDGYGAFYKIRQLLNTDVIDGDNLVAIVNYPTLVAEKINDATIETIINEIQELQNYVEYMNNNNRVSDHFRYYIDGINGNDNNDGLTSETAFKTIDKFLSIGNRRSDIACYIISVGTYNISNKSILSGMVVHIKSNLPNPSDVIIRSDENVVIYNSHLNFENITYDCNGHIENTAGTFQNCIFINSLILYGGYHYFTNCRVNRIVGFGINAYLTSLTIDGKAKGRSALEFTRSSNVDIANLTFETPEEKTTSFIYTLGCNLSMRGSFNYTKLDDPTLDYEDLQLTSTIWNVDNTLYNNINNNYTITKSRCLINHGNTILPQ